MHNFYFLICVLDGYSRYILSHDLRVTMETYDVEIVLQRALEQYPEASPRLISDNGGQFIGHDFKEFIGHTELVHVRTSVNYPQSNGKLERFHGTIKQEEVRKSSYLSLSDARRQIARYIRYYNTRRLHSSLNYLTPEDYLLGRVEKRLQARKENLQHAKEQRKKIRKRLRKSAIVN